MGTRKSFAGGAQRTSLSAPITNSALSFTVQAGGGAGYPTGASGPFVVAVDTGLASEEKVLCSARSSDTFTVQAGGRGYDGTAAAAHNNQANVDHVLDSVTVDEANAHANDTTGDPHPQYALEATFTQARAVRATAQGIPHNALTVIAFDGETFDPSGIRDPGGDRILLNRVGRWLVTGQVSFDPNATGVRRASILLNGVAQANPQVPNAGGTSYTGVPVSDIVNATAITDYVQLAALQDSGGALDTSTTGVTFLAVTYLGA